MRRSARLLTTKSDIALEHLSGYLTLTLPTQWGELDAFGHINNIWSFRYFESIRIHQFHLVGQHLKANGQEAIGVGFLNGKGIGPILAATSCRYKRPGEFPDTLEIGVKTTDMTPHSFTHQYRIVSRNRSWIMSEGTAEIVCFDYVKGKKGEWPGPLQEAIKMLDGSN